MKDDESEETPFIGLSVLIAILLIIAGLLAILIWRYSPNKSSDYTSLATCITSIVLALITVVTLRENRRISQTTIDIANKSLEETKLMREAQTEPFVIIRIQPREDWLNWIELIVENVGLGPAYEFQATINPNMDELMGTKVSEFGFVKGKIACLGPKQQIRIFLTDFAERPDEKINAIYQVHVSYKNASGKLTEEDRTINFAELSGISQLGKPPLFSIAEETKLIREELSKFSRPFFEGNLDVKPRILVYTPEDLKKANEERKERGTRKVNNPSKK